MSSDTIDRILRYGAGPEFADHFEEVGVMRALYTLKDVSNGEYEIAALGVVQCYGEERGRQVTYAEAFEACEYGAPLSDAAVRRLFPFF